MTALHSGCELSAAIVQYIGYGSAKCPSENPDAIRVAQGDVKAGQLIPVVEIVMKKLEGLQPDWPTQSLVQAGNWAKEQMRMQHPELTEDALSALEWTFTWWWK